MLHSISPARSFAFVFLLLSWRPVLVYGRCRRPCSHRMSRVMTVHRRAHGRPRLSVFQAMKIAFKMSLRRNLKSYALFALAALALLSAAPTTRAWAGYPDHIIRIVVPF